MTGISRAIALVGAFSLVAGCSEEHIVCDAPLFFQTGEQAQYRLHEGGQESLVTVDVLHSDADRVTLRFSQESRVRLITIPQACGATWPALSSLEEILITVGGYWLLDEEESDIAQRYEEQCEAQRISVSAGEFDARYCGREIPASEENRVARLLHAITTEEQRPLSGLLLYRIEYRDGSVDSIELDAWNGV